MNLVLPRSAISSRLMEGTSHAEFLTGILPGSERSSLGCGVSVGACMCERLRAGERCLSFHLHLINIGNCRIIKIKSLSSIISQNDYCKDGACMYFLVQALTPLSSKSPV